MSQLRVSSIATTAGTTNITLSNNGIGIDTKPIISGQVGSFGQQNSATLIAFDEFWVQRGITWNASTKRFTVPVAGIYRITMNPFFATGVGGGRIYIGINTDTPGGTTHRGHCYREAATYDTASLDSVVSLSANDYICFYLAGGSLYGNSGDRFSQFTIERIA